MTEVTFLHLSDTYEQRDKTSFSKVKYDLWLEFMLAPWLGNVVKSMD